MTDKVHFRKHGEQKSHHHGVCQHGERRFAPLDFLRAPGQQAARNKSDVRQVVIQQEHGEPGKPQQRPSEPRAVQRQRHGIAMFREDHVQQVSCSGPKSDQPAQHPRVARPLDSHQRGGKLQPVAHHRFRVSDQTVGIARVPRGVDASNGSGGDDV